MIGPVSFVSALFGSESFISNRVLFSTFLYIQCCWSILFFLYIDFVKNGMC